MPETLFDWVGDNFRNYDAVKVLETYMIEDLKLNPDAITPSFDRARAKIWTGPGTFFLLPRQLRRTI